MVEGEAHIDVLSDELIGNAVVMAVDLDMVIDIDRCLLPVGILVEPAAEALRAGSESPAGLLRNTQAEKLRLQ